MADKADPDGGTKTTKDDDGWEWWYPEGGGSGTSGGTGGAGDGGTAGGGGADGGTSEPPGLPYDGPTIGPTPPDDPLTPIPEPHPWTGYYHGQGRPYRGGR